MKKIKVELEVEVDEETYGLLIVPTNKKEMLQGHGAAIIANTQQCKNGVSLRAVVPSEPDES